MKFSYTITKVALPLIVYLSVQLSAKAQITTPIIKANFGVEADLRSNYFNGLLQAGNDDWYDLAGTAGSGKGVIDTNGAAGILANYNTNPLSKQLPFYRTMRVPQYSVINNRLLIDAYFVRDYHGDDSTIFSGGNKNGMSPAIWTCPVSQSIPDKNEILDVYMHVRRAGPNVTDSMWLFGGLSIENTTGNRYFDFELYQTDIYYNRGTRRFYNYGPDAGHTSWKFNTSHGLEKPGDIILTAEYGSSSLSFVQARIWINKNEMTLHPNPVDFNWSGTFDGDGTGAQYGYAGITPKTSGAFYTGLQSANNTWAGAFQLVLGNNTVVTTYTARQFMEFSVNMSKLGLDDPAIFGGDDCIMPFRRVMVKTRASTSFTAELKDFVAPFDFFLAPKAEVATTVPMICDTGSAAQIFVINPIATSIYNWTTIGGNIVGPTTGSSIIINRPGTYIVTQRLQAACNAYASDTIVIGRVDPCYLLKNKLLDLHGNINANNTITLLWKCNETTSALYYDIERSRDGNNFEKINTITISQPLANHQYSFTDNLATSNYANFFYRIRLRETDGKSQLSNTKQFLLNSKNDILLYPNPFKDQLHISIMAKDACKANLLLVNTAGHITFEKEIEVQKGNNIFNLNMPQKISDGIYMAIIKSNGIVMASQKLYLMK